MTETNGKHPYNGPRNSRGQRTMSKIHKGLKSGNVERAFQLVEKLRIKERKKR